MHKFFTSAENFIGDEAKILGDDVKHIYKVLRLSEGEIVTINNCSGEEFLGKIKLVSKQEVIVEITEKLDVNNESNVEIFLYQGLPKAQKMDLIVQKGTELGINKFIPVITARVDIKLKGEFKKLDRLNRISLEAAKQSKRTIIPIVEDPIKFEDMIKSIEEMDLMLVPYENAENFGIKTLFKDFQGDKNFLDKIKKVGVLVGPEGGFEQEEIEILKNSGAKIITLGNRILRTETAGFVATSLIQYELGDLGGNY